MSDPKLVNAAETARIARLRAVPLFASLSDEQLALVHPQERTVAEGEFIARQGDTDTIFAVVVSGELRVFQQVDSGGKAKREVTVRTAVPGNSLGELPLLTNQPCPVFVQATKPSFLLTFTVEAFWRLLADCPSIRWKILTDMSTRFKLMQQGTLQREKLASLGTLAAGLMHELNNPGAAASRAASQLRANLTRMHQLTSSFRGITLTDSQKQCMFDLQKEAIEARPTAPLSSLEQSDAEESLAAWLEANQIADAWKLAPTLVSIGFTSQQLECARQSFTGNTFSTVLNWLEALVSSMQLVGTIEESISRVADLVSAVKGYAYEDKGQCNAVDINKSIHSTLVILGHKLREKQIAIEKDLSPDLPQLRDACPGLNQVWTNIIDNAIDALPQSGTISIRTTVNRPNTPSAEIAITIQDNGSGIPPESQPQIFEPFYTTKPVGKGTGLGLGIAHRVVEECGGNIQFTSQPGKTIFTISLPARPSSTA